MSRTGCCYDNAVAERFFWSLKHEWTKHETLTNLEESRLSVFRYIETFYNTDRFHESLNYLKPQQFETQHDHQLAIKNYKSTIHQSWAGAPQQTANIEGLAIPDMVKSAISRAGRLQVFTTTAFDVCKETRFGIFTDWSLERVSRFASNVAG